MDDFITARRKDDAVVSVCQDNKKKNVLILGLNQAARNLLKYEEGNLLNKPLINILSARAADDMKNYLEYTENGHDLLDILPKVIDFSLTDAKGEDIRTKVKVFRTAQFASNKINYELLIRDISLSHKLGIFRDKYLMGKKYKNHDLFDIPGNESTILELYVILNFAFQHQINAAIGVIGLNSSCSETNNALKVIIEHFYKNCRSDDFLGYIDENKVLFVLINCDVKSTSKIINRIHSAINKQLLMQKLPSVSIIYGNIAQKQAAKSTSGAF
ncbi:MULTISPECIES: hypothetical protein [Wolbachia]|uniref:Uncharacterized protein n=1 Tax=Wolbachia pipientis TaxID=955 RepID=A0A6I6CK28_WOLPI|nr:MULTISPECIES: hypothetical protein [Wolbachia]MBA8757983.1 hypothetical protein [Wolbachia pipientis]MBA8769927.1 hypothetical protein [Wolbachia pipientis]MBS9529785.1 hypothetical protein [Wolbachia endosymbiont of Ceratitis capitata]QGT16339.1 hypothetical protein E0495_03665 [Wolbachia pipientis]